MNAFVQALQDHAPLILDGGLATELEARAHDLGTELWSARLLHDNPRAIVGVHQAYLEAGADIITTASYQASREGFMKLGLSAFAADQLITESVNLASKAREAFMRKQPRKAFRPLIAASIGPWGATLHDGSEYTGHYEIPEDKLKSFHTARLQLFEDSDADVLACETIPSHVEGRVLHQILRLVEKPAWVSFSCRDGRHISDGTPLRDMAAMFADHRRVAALGVNCTAPQHITSLIHELHAAAPDKPIIVYPNSGERWEASDNSWVGTVEPLDVAEAALTWREAGAAVIGGCCRMGPAHIRALRQALKNGASK